jgi:hypothetical protein
MKQAAPSLPQGMLEASLTNPHATDLISIAQVLLSQQAKLSMKNVSSLDICAPLRLAKGNLEMNGGDPSKSMVEISSFIHIS